MKYYKTTTIVNGALHTFVNLSAGAKIKMGWSITDMGHKKLTMPATKAEYDMFWHGYIWCYMDKPMRTKVEYLTQVQPDIGVKVRVETTTFIPNRHQRKHGIRIVERG